MAKLRPATAPETLTIELRAQLARSVGEASLDRAEALHRLAWELRNTDATEAHALAEEALVLARHLRDQRVEAFALVARAYSAVRLSHGAEAIVDAEAAVELFHDHDDKVGLARALNTLGIGYGDSSRFMDALQVFLRLLALCEKSEDRIGEADALNNIAIVYVNLDDHSAALEYHLRSLQLAREIGYASGETRSLTNLGSVAYELGHYDEALTYLQESVEKHAHGGVKSTYGITLVNLGRCYHKLDRFDEALDVLAEALDLLDELDHSLGVAYALDTIGSVLLDRGDTELALQRLRDSLTIKGKAEDRKGQAATLLLLASAHRAIGQPEEAEAMLESALASAVAIGARTETYKAHLQLSEIWEERGDLSAALRHFKTYNRVKDELFNEASDIKVRALRVGFEVEQARKESEIYRLKNVELAKANEKLEVLARSLREADAQKSRLLKQVERQAREDALTGIGNRRHFDHEIATSFPRQRRARKPIGIALCDIDDFKRVNDEHGHAVGDSVLRIVAQLLKRHTRKRDLVARYGGEEFIAMLPDTTPEAAYAICERMRRAVEAYDWSSIAPGVRVTLSVGLASDPSVGHHERLIGIADTLLYRAKARGKNQVVADRSEGSSGAGARPDLVNAAIGSDGQAKATVAPLADRPTRAEVLTDAALPPGLTLHRREAPLETVTTQVGSLSLLTTGDALELNAGTLDEGGRMTLLPSDREHPVAEAYHVLDGTLVCSVGDDPIEIHAGDTLRVEGLEQPVILSALAPVRFLYTSPEPSFHMISRELDELRKLAVEVEAAAGAGHCERIQTLAYAIGEALDLPKHRLHLLDYAAYLHDVGKVDVPKTILSSPEPLDEAAWKLIWQHPTRGAELIAQTFMAAAAPIVAQHHERLDGSGYPLGLAGDEILLEAHIVAVADTFDAMISDRPYRRAMPRDAALAELRQLSGSAFPAIVVEALERVLPTLPF